MVIFEGNSLRQLALEGFEGGFGNGIVIRISRTRNPCGNAVAESFF